MIWTEGLLNCPSEPRHCLAGEQTQQADKASKNENAGTEFAKTAQAHGWGGALDSGGWRMHAAALPQQFADARAEADRMIEPQIHHVRLPGTTIRTPKDVRSWIARAKQELLGQIRKNPIAIR